MPLAALVPGDRPVPHRQRLRGLRLRGAPAARSEGCAAGAAAGEHASHDGLEEKREPQVGPARLIRPPAGANRRRRGHVRSGRVHRRLPWRRRWRPRCQAVREVVARAVAEPPRSSRAGRTQARRIQKLYHAPDLTILNVVWAPRMTFMPHNHQMWAVIGIYTGREDNIFWRRMPGGQAARSKPPARRRCARGTPSRSATTSSTR